MSRLGKAKKSLKFLTRDEELQKLIAMPVMYVPKNSIGAEDLKEIKTYVTDILGTLDQFKQVLTKADHLLRMCQVWSACNNNSAPEYVTTAMEELSEALHGKESN